MTNLRFSWTWDADARNWRLSQTDMDDGLVAGYDHMAGYNERQLIEEIERLRGQSPVDKALKQAFHAEPQRTTIDDALRRIASPNEPTELKKLPLRVIIDSSVPPDTIELRRPDGALLGTITNLAMKTCEDCPPVGYPTDETRCAPCPRRAEKSVSQSLARLSTPN